MAFVWVCTGQAFPHNLTSTVMHMSVHAQLLVIAVISVRISNMNYKRCKRKTNMQLQYIITINSCMQDEDIAGTIFLDLLILLVIKITTL